MNAAREDILARIRALDRAQQPTAPRAYRRRDDRTREEIVAQFCERVADYRAEVRRVDDVAAAVALAAKSAKRIGTPPGLPNGWRPSGLELVEDRGLSPTELDVLDGALTGCTLGIAETGTIVLTAGPTEGRRALTLVPDLHICVIHEAQIVGLVPEAIAQIEVLVTNDRRPITFVSGPSATSDIELQRVEGVHGPRTLVVLVVAD